MSIRRAVRNAIKSGSMMYAKVEDVHLGLATVRLGGTGARMTNLSTVGGEVQVGDEVVVDWSAGVNPIVRPLFLETEEEELPDGVSVPEQSFEDEDISAAAWTYFYPHYYNGQEYPLLYSGQWFTLPGGDNMDDTYVAEIWDTSNINKNTAFYEDGKFTAPRDGKYLIGFSWWEQFEANYYGWYSNAEHHESETYYAQRIVKNGSIIVGEATGNYDNNGNWGGCSSMNNVIMEYLEAGDTLEFQVYFESAVINEYAFENWGTYEFETRYRWIAYIPGT